MRIPALVVAATVAWVGTAGAAQDSKKQQPKRGDEIVVEGCLSGTMLESADVGAVHDGVPLHSGLNFQLKGKKDVLRELTARHDGQLVEITGVLKSSLDTGASRGRMIGRTRVVIGVRSTTPDRAMMPASEEMLPVLEVKSFESASVNCRR